MTVTHKYAVGQLVHCDYYPAYNPFRITSLCYYTAVSTPCYTIESVPHKNKQAGEVHRLESGLKLVDQAEWPRDPERKPEEPYKVGELYELGPLGLAGEFVTSRQIKPGRVDYLFWVEGQGYETTRQADRPAVPKTCPACNQSLPES